MNWMNCADSQRLMHAYIDAELDVEASAAIERHLRLCSKCARLREQEKRLRFALEKNAVFLYARAPENLTRKVRSAIMRAARRAQAGSFALSWRRSGVVLSLAALTLVLWSIAPLLAVFTDRDDLTQEVISSHVRSLMADHMFDVASSDKHTVKPWFSGKLNFSPPVRDFVGQGFKLAGGRLEYLANQPAAAVIYRHEKHYINLFVLPARDISNVSSQDVESASAQGYFVFHWTHANMNYWAVSDLDPARLQEFVHLLRTPAG